MKSREVKSDRLFCGTVLLKKPCLKALAGTDDPPLLMGFSADNKGYLTAQFACVASTPKAARELVIDWVEVRYGPRMAHRMCFQDVSDVRQRLRRLRRLSAKVRPGSVWAVGPLMLVDDRKRHVREACNYAVGAWTHAEPRSRSGLWYLLIEAAPRPGSYKTRGCGGAFVNLWIRSSRRPQAILIARKVLRKEGWNGRVLCESRPVSQRSMRAEWLPKLERAVETGFDATFHTWPKG